MTDAHSICFCGDEECRLWLEHGYAEASGQSPAPPSYWREGMGKYGSSLSFEGGLLLINIAGYGDRDGLGQIAFKSEDVKEDGEGYLCVGLPNSELIAIRDELNKWFPPSATA